MADTGTSRATAVASCKPEDGGGVALVLLGDDGRLYDVRLTAECRRQIIGHLQSVIAREFQLPTLTLHDAQPAVSAQSKSPALVISTVEIGAFAFVLNASGLRAISEAVAKLSTL